MSALGQNVAARMFKPSDMSTIARNSIFSAASIAVLVCAVLATDGWLRIALGLIALHRAFGLTLAVIVGGEVIAERERRLNALPAAWLTFLRTGTLPTGGLR